MAQLPVKNETFMVLNLLKAKAVKAMGGLSPTWDDVISSMANVCGKHSLTFDEVVRLKKGKTRRVKIMRREADVEDSLKSIKEKVEDGERVSSEDLEELGKNKRMIG